MQNLGWSAVDQPSSPHGFCSILQKNPEILSFGFETVDALRWVIDGDELFEAALREVFFRAFFQQRSQVREAVVI